MAAKLDRKTGKEFEMNCKDEKNNKLQQNLREKWGKNFT